MAAFTAFMIAALAITILMFLLSSVIAFAQERVVDTLRSSLTEVKKWGGRILILVGLWLIVLAIFAETFANIFRV
ncbi:MAG TPA: hypothetical protein VIK64_09635 [Anaerolineales bacterium]